MGNVYKMYSILTVGSLNKDGSGDQEEQSEIEYMELVVFNPTLEAGKVTFNGGLGSTAMCCRDVCSDGRFWRWAASRILFGCTRVGLDDGTSSTGRGSLSSTIP